MTRTLPVLVVAFAVPLAVGQDPKPKAALPKVTAHGIAVTKPGPADDAPTIGITGTQVTVLVEIPDRFIVGFDTQDSKIESFTDDRGTDLQARAGVRGGRSAVAPSGLGNSGDGKYLKVIVYGTGLPAAGATKVHVKGTVAALVGKTEKTVEKKDVAIKDGVDAGFGKFTLRATTGFGPNPARGTALSYLGTKVLKQVSLVDAAGAEVPLRLTGSTSVAARAAGRGGPTVSTFTPGRGVTLPDKCTLKVTYFEEVETFEVPVDLAAGLGL